MLEPMSPEDAQQRIDQARASYLSQMMYVIYENVSLLDKCDEKTLIVLIQSLLALNIGQQQVADILGVHRGSVARWIGGANITRSTPFRAWMVNTLLDFVRKNRPGSFAPPPQQRKRGRPIQRLQG
jgi:hypothetical protein